MLDLHHLNSIRAALRYWLEEVCPHGDEAVAPYLDHRDQPALSGVGVERLLWRFHPSAVRYDFYDLRRSRLKSRRLFSLEDEALGKLDPETVATVLPPAGAD